MEADEASFDRTNVTKDLAYKDAVKKGKCILWLQWSGMLARGKPSTLLLSRLNPKLTVKRAPGPGAIHKGALGQEAPRGPQGGVAYDVVHDAVVRCKKKVQGKGKTTTWTNPQYVRVAHHQLPGGKVLKVKAGTQHIDRAWKFLKERLRLNQHVKAGAQAIRRRIRAAQYGYWFRGQDMWHHTANLVAATMSNYAHAK